VLDAPEDVAAALLADTSIFGVRAVDVVVSAPELAVFWITMMPPAPMAAEDYPEERFSVVVWDTGEIAAIPHDANSRTWIHRYADVLGRLCLQYRYDPRTLRWEWDDGLAEFVKIAHRHLLFEEYARRNDGEWPVEDAPHGGSVRPHPIRTLEMRAAATKGNQ
jgi:hypothetical protein